MTAFALLQVAAPSTTALFALLFAISFFNTAIAVMALGPICAEAVPPHLMATASGVVIGAAEIFGGGLSPIAVGHLITAFGIAHFLVLPLGAMILATCISLFLKEAK